MCHLFKCGKEKADEGKIVWDWGDGSKVSVMRHFPEIPEVAEIWEFTYYPDQCIISSCVRNWRSSFT